MIAAFPKLCSCAIVMACDEPYAMPLATALRSIADSNLTVSVPDVYVLTTHFSEEAKTKVMNSLPRGSISVHWTTVDLSSFETFSTRPYISSMTYGRLMISHVLPTEVTRALYLDADILVLASLAALWQLDLGQSVLAAADDIDSDRHATRLSVDGTGGAPSDGYFNAGVLLIDLPRWRESRIAEQAIEYLQRNPATFLSDQDALNVVCRGRWKLLDERFNFQNHQRVVFGRQLPSELPAIVHFVTCNKPWDARALSMNARFYNTFRDRTAFAQLRRDKLADALQSGWCRAKRRLKKSVFIRSAWKHARRQILWPHRAT